MTSQTSIIASALYGNKGAASMLEASLQMMEPGAAVGLLSLYPEHDARLADGTNLQIFDATPLRLVGSIIPLSALYRLLPPLRSSIRKIEPAVGFLADSQVLLDQGGITFSDGREKFLPYNVASVLPGLILGVPVVKCAQAIGPFANRLNRILARLVLPRIDTIVARGERTHQMLDELGLGNVVAGVDLAFAIEPSESSVHKVKSSYPSLFAGDDWVGLCPSQVARRQLEAVPGTDPETYGRVLISVVDHLLANGFRVALIPHSYMSDDAKTHNNDLPLCAAVAQHFANENNRVLLLDSELSATELRIAIAQTQVLITSRFHGMVSALAAGVPPLVFGWGHKYREVLAMFELDDAGLDAAQMVDEATVRNAVDRVLESRDERQAKIAAKLPLVIAAAKDHQGHFEAAR